ncbi:MAG: ATPase, T2SS/T4P/T4SS family [Candidatus Omnitrophica bacterium]|nr:ATPase, T2SS/T4P/T4SS family [Candidatus Omnitrophota bacterium]
MLSFKDRLSEILIKNKLITGSQLEQALDLQAESGGALSDIIAGFKFVEYNRLYEILEKELQMPLFSLGSFEIDPGAIEAIPFKTAGRYQVIPISRREDRITIAMADPLNIFAVERLPELSGLQISPVISPARDIRQAIELYYPAAFELKVNNLAKESPSAVELSRPQKNIPFSPQDIDYIIRESPVTGAADKLLEAIVEKGASDALIESFGRQLRVRFRIQGALEEEAAFSAESISLIALLKNISGMNPGRQDLLQEGRFRAAVRGRKFDLAVSVLPSVSGERVVLHLPDRSGDIPDIENLGMSVRAAGVLKKAMRLNQGLVLICGEPESGKSTTLYSILGSLNNPDKNIVTIEEHVEVRLAGINQVTVAPDIGFTFSAGIRSILLQDPNIIMVGAARDYETIDMVVKSAFTGHLVFSAFDAATASGALSRLAGMGVESYLINSSLVCVIAQRLLRKLCRYCRKSYVPDNKIIEDLKIDTHEIGKPYFYKAEGCPHCRGLGYSGKVMIAEALQMDRGMQELISGGADESAIRNQARQAGMQSLRQAGFDAALKGLTTIEEVLRLTAPEE